MKDGSVRQISYRQTNVHSNKTKLKKSSQMYTYSAHFHLHANDALSKAHVYIINFKL